MHQMIIHIFIGYYEYHVPAMLKNFCMNLDNDSNHYIIWVNGKEMASRYHRYLEEVGCSTCRLYMTTHSLSSTSGRIRELLAWFQIAWTCRNHTVIAHFNPNIRHFLIFSLLGIRHAFVFWSSPVKRSRFFKIFSGILCRKTRKLLCLSKSDLAMAREYYPQISSACINYFTPSGELPPVQTEKVIPKSILLGNNATFLNAYIEILSSFSKYKAPADMMVCCMTAFSGSKELRDQLKVLIRKMPFNVICQEQNLLLNDYFRFLQQYEIFVFNCKRQGALAAIYTMLFYGKKVFLSGCNLQTFQAMNCRVFDVNELFSCNWEDIFTPLSEKEKNNNKKIIMEILNRDQVRASWEQLCTELEES